MLEAIHSGNWRNGTLCSGTDMELRNNREKKKPKADRDIFDAKRLNAHTLAIGAASC
jgi:hypothetical protein